MRFLSGNHKKTIGIDFGTTSIKLLELSGSSKSVVVDRYGYEPLAPGLIIDRQIKDVERVSNVLKRLLKRSGTKAKRVSTCVSANNVISKVITVQSDLDEDELQAMVEVEAEKAVPYDLEEVNIDYARVGPSAQSPGEDAVQIVVCQKSIVEDLTEVIELAGLEASVVDVDLFSLGNVHRYANQNRKGTKNNTSALIDFGFNASRLMVFHNDVMVYQRDTSLGGRQLVDGIQRKYGTAVEDAIVAIKRNKLPQSYKKEVLKPYVKTLIQETIRSLQFFFSSATHSQIDRLVLTGGCAKIGNIDQIVQQRLEIPTSVLDPFQSARIGSKVDEARFHKDMPYLGLVSGLAMRGLS